MSQLELIASLIRDEDRVSRASIDECARGGDSMLDHLDAVLAVDPHSNEEHTSGEWWLRHHTAMILGLMNTERAGLMLVKLMRWLDAADDQNMQEWLLTAWPALFRNKPDTALGPLRDLTEDRRCDWSMRHAALDAVIAFEAERSESTHEGSLDWVAQLVATEGDDWDFRVTAANALLDYAPVRHRSLLEDMARRQKGTLVHFGLDEVHAAYDTPERFPPRDRVDNPWTFYEPDAIARRQIRWAKEDADEDSRGVETAKPASISSAPKVGRNDPCPCGSGKKYKRCCIDS